MNQQQLSLPSGTMYLREEPFTTMEETRHIKEAFEGQPIMDIGRDTMFLTPNRTGARVLLESRPTPSVPYMGSGQTIITDVDIYSRYLVGLDTSSKKASQPTSGISIDRTIPLAGPLAQEIQNVKHIIPTHWVRGGMSTRAVIQNIDYLERCDTNSPYDIHHI